MHKETTYNDITTAQPFLEILPENEDIFAESNLFLAKHLLPLVSIDLSIIHSEWQGKIHLLNPIEPYECYIGSETTQFANEFANENWFVMKLNDKYRYEWLGDRKYFALENSECDADLRKHSQEMHLDYSQVKQRFLATGKVISGSDVAYENDEPTVLLNQLGGDANYGNWNHPISDHFELKIINEDTDGEVAHVYDQNGLRYYFIASASGWEYCNHGADDILMFYQPETKRVLYTFDWT